MYEMFLAWIGSILGWGCNEYVAVIVCKGRELHKSCICGWVMKGRIVHLIWLAHGRWRLLVLEFFNELEILTLYFSMERI